MIRDTLLPADVVARRPGSVPAATAPATLTKIVALTTGT